MAGFTSIAPLDPDHEKSKRNLVGKKASTEADLEASSGAKRWSLALHQYRKVSRLRSCLRRGVIHPEFSWGLRKWDAACGVGLVFVCFASPFEVSFLDDDAVTTGAPLFWINRLVDMLFFTDMILQFNIAFPVRTKSNVMYITDRTKIAKHYLRTWFTVDLISIMPFDLFGLIFDSDDVRKLRLLKVIRLFRLLKLLRLLKGMRMFERWQNELGISHRKLTLWQLLITVVVSAHWISCALGLASSIHGVPCIHHEPADCKVTWASRAFEESGIVADDDGRIPPGRNYLVALYTSITIIVHPHVYHPTGSEEHLVFIFLLLLGGFVWTHVISRSTAISTSLDRHKIFYNQTMDDVNSIAREVGLSVALQRQLRIFFMNTKDTSQQVTWQNLTKRMSPHLRRQTLRETNWPWVQKVVYLKGCSMGMVTAVAEGLETERYAQHEVFGKQCHLYILSKGVVTRSINVAKFLKPGAVWGEDHMILHCTYLFEDVSAVAQTFAEVLVMPRKRFDEILDDHLDELGGELQNGDRIRKHYVKLSVIRGIRYMARQVKEQFKANSKKEENGENAEKLEVSEQMVANLEENKQEFQTIGQIDFQLNPVLNNASPINISPKRSSRRSKTMGSPVRQLRLSSPPGGTGRLSETALSASVSSSMTSDDYGGEIKELRKRMEDLKQRMRSEMVATRNAMNGKIDAIDSLFSKVLVNSKQNGRQDASSNVGLLAQPDPEPGGR